MMNESVIVGEYNYIKSHIQNIDSINDICIRDCHNKYFHLFDHICVYDINLTNITNIELFNLTIFDENISLYELIKN